MISFIYFMIYFLCITRSTFIKEGVLLLHRRIFPVVASLYERQRPTWNTSTLSRRLSMTSPVGSNSNQNRKSLLLPLIGKHVFHVKLYATWNSGVLPRNRWNLVSYSQRRLLVRYPHSLLSHLFGIVVFLG